MVDRKPDEESKSDQRSITTGYWKNEPGFLKSQRTPSKDASERPDRSNDEPLEERDRESEPPLPEQRDEFENNEFYANRGWTRSAAKERQRDWGYTNSENYTRDEPLYIDFNRRAGNDQVYDPKLAERDKPETD